MVLRILFLILFLVGGSTTQACDIKLRVSSFEPFMIKHETGWAGIDVEQARAVANRLDCHLLFVEAPWARGLSLLKAGKVDVMVNMSRTAAREKFLYFAGPQRIESIRLVSTASNFKLVTSWYQLSHLDATLMRQRGSFFGKRFEQLLRRNIKLKRQLVETSSHDFRLDLIDKGRVDGFIIDMTYFYYLRKVNPKAQRLIVHPLSINDSPVYFAFSKQSISKPRMVEIELAISTLIEEGTIKRIMASYL